MSGNTEGQWSPNYTLYLTRFECQFVSRHLVYDRDCPSDLLVKPTVSRCGDSWPGYRVKFAQFGHGFLR